MREISTRVINEEQFREISKEHLLMPASYFCKEIPKGISQRYIVVRRSGKDVSNEIYYLYGPVRQSRH